LPVRCLRESLLGNRDAALDALGQVRYACAQHERAEAALDVGTGLLEHGASAAQVERYLPLSEEVAQRGVRYRVEELRSALRLAIGDVEGARVALGHAREQLAWLLERLDETYRDQLLEHPWVKGLLRVRAVP